MRFSSVGVLADVVDLSFYPCESASMCSCTSLTITNRWSILSNWWLFRGLLLYHTGLSGTHDRSGCR